MRQDDRLRQALDEYAREEAEQFARSMTREERRQAETLFRRHRKSMLALIARRTRSKAARPVAVMRAAAMLLLLLGGAYLLFRQAPQDIVPLALGPTVSVAPYYTDTPAPTALQTLSPTGTPIPTAIPTSSPTETPIPAEIPTPSPTSSPTSTPEPTYTPAPQRAALQQAAVPDGWSGLCFPALLPADYFADGLQSSEGVHTAIFSNGDDRILFTENESLSSLPIAPDAGVTYVQWDDVVALRAQKDGQVELTWDQFGRSFSLLCTSGELAEEIARTVRQLGR